MASTNTGIIHSNAHINKEELLKKIGGEATLHRAVDEFYARLLNDEELKPFFEHANMTVLKW
jgi:truncated hemoglobin YjbI